MSRVEDTPDEPCPTLARGAGAVSCAVQDDRVKCTPGMQYMVEHVATHISRDPAIYGGRPCIDGHRIAVHDVAASLGSEQTPEQIAVEFGPHVVRFTPRSLTTSTTKSRSITS